MHKKEENNEVRTVLCGFPNLFAQWLSAHLSKKDNIKISAILPDIRYYNGNTMKEHDLLLVRISTPDEIISLPDQSYNQKRLLVWWSGQTINDEIMIELVNAGASGILADHHLLEDIEEAILNVSEYKVHMNDLLSNALFHYCRKQNIIGGNHIGRAISFSEREKKVIELRKAGYTSKAIAEQLFLSKKTVDKVFCDLYRRLECTNFFEVLERYERKTTIHYRNYF